MMDSDDSRLRRGYLVVIVIAVVLAGVAIGAVALAEPVAAHEEEETENGGQSAGGGTNVTRSAGGLCQFPAPEWRAEQTVAGVHVQESRRCRPDNPATVAAAVRGTNNVPSDVLMRSGFAGDAVRKCCDRDGDGDPDVIHITLEIHELNTGAVEHDVAPGVSPGMWVFSPKTSGMVENGTAAARVIRAPSPSLRVEKGDTVRVTVENTHYLPHTIHFHGVDHAYETNGAGDTGNDGVPQTSEQPIMPGDSRTYEFTPRQAGTMFYHCHVTPNAHIQMGLSGMFVVTEDDPDNAVQTVNVGAGKVRHPPEGVRGDAESVYDLHYQALDRNLTRVVKEHSDPREVAAETNRGHDATEGTMDYYLLNGRSFPYTLQESPIVVERGEQYRLRVLNSGPRDVAVHTHGHKVSVEAYDGVELPESTEITRDVVEVAPAQRVDLMLNTTDDGLHAYGPGVWFMHDHHEPAVTTDGISPGGNVNVITYASYLNRSTAMPRTETDLGRYFNSTYYDGEIPYWGGLDGKLAAGNATSTATAAAVDHWTATSGMRMDMTMVEGGLVVNENTDDLPFGCEEIADERRITVAAGEQYGEAGEMYAFNRSRWEVDPCTRVRVRLVNADDVRHQWMVHGLLRTTYPMGMFNIEANGGRTVEGTFITPGVDTRLQVHCSVPMHDMTGMNGTIVVGDPGPNESSATEADSGTASTSRSPGEAGTDAQPTTTSATGDLPTVLAVAGIVLLLGVLAARQRLRR